MPATARRKNRAGDRRRFGTDFFALLRRKRGFCGGMRGGLVTKLSVVYGFMKRQEGIEGMG